MKEIDKLECILRKTTKIIKDLETKPGEGFKYVQELDMFSLENKKVRGDMVAILKYLKGCYAEVCFLCLRE